MNFGIIWVERKDGALVFCIKIQFFVLVADSIPRVVAAATVKSLGFVTSPAV